MKKDLLNYFTHQWLTSRTQTMLFFTQCKVYFYPKVAALGEEDQKTSVPVCWGWGGGRRGGRPEGQEQGASAD